MFSEKHDLNQNLTDGINFLFIRLSLRFTEKPVLILNLADGINYTVDLFPLLSLCFAKGGFKTKPPQWHKFPEMRRVE